MFWADQLAETLKDKPQHVTDGKTPSGRIHVGSLRGVLIHDAVYQALHSQKAKVQFTYIFDDMDAFDRVPAGLDEKTFSEYLGIPLYKVPSPDQSSGSFAEFFAQEFIEVLGVLGITPTILWQSKLHQEGVLDEAIKIALDNADKIADIYHTVSGSKKKETAWWPFQPTCEKCGKIGTTRVTGWDGKEISYECVPNLVTWAKGCGNSGKVSPFGGTGKLPWKIYWPARWKALATTVEGQGKDLASKGGARDVANHVAKEIFDINPPLDIPYEFFLYGGARMSTSKGVGFAAKEVVEILPPELVRFLMLKSRPMQAINFDPTDPVTIPKLFDEYDKAADAFIDKSDPLLARIFELSQIGAPEMKKMMRFKDVVNLLQMPGKEKELEGETIAPRVLYAKIWLDRFAPEDEKFVVKEEFPENALHLSEKQKMFLGKLAESLEKDWEPDSFQQELYDRSKELELSSKEAFAAIYTVLIDKDHGPKAAWLILSLDKAFVVNRFKQAAG